jgi:uncharacterized protein (DUF1697 family)
LPVPTYIALLRGVNLGAHNRMKMDQLRQSLEGLGFVEVRTYIQSGNVVFKAARQSPSDLSRRIDQRILRDFGLSVFVISRTAAELGKAIHNNPFLREKGVDSSKLHVTFLSKAPAQSSLKKLDTLAVGGDQFRYCSKEIYLYCPNGLARTKLFGSAFERVLAVSATTTRNWRTVNTLYAMSLGHS